TGTSGIAWHYLRDGGLRHLWARAINPGLVGWRGRSRRAILALHRAPRHEHHAPGDIPEMDPGRLRALEPGLGGLGLARVEADAALVEARLQAVRVLEHPRHPPVDVAVVVAHHEVAL